MYKTGNVRKLYIIAKIPKRNGSKRILEIPTKSLKKFQRKILEEVLYKFGPHKAAHGFVKNRSPLTNAKVHVKAAIIIKLDIRDFFRRTKKWTIKSAMDSAKTRMSLSDEDIAQLLEYTMHEGHLPTGAPTSPALGNICLHRMDTELYKYCRSHNLRYTRYADDITISSKKRIDKSEIGHIVTKVQALLKERGHVLRYDKIRIFSRKNRMEVTGVVINEKPNISKKYRANVRAAIHQAKDGNDIEKIEGRISWVNQIAPHHAGKLQSQLLQKKQALGLN